MRITWLATLVVLLWGASAPFADDGQRPPRNAIFNGAFVEGVSGFSVLGPGHKSVALSTEKSQHAQTLITELIVACPAMERTFTIYSSYLLQVEPEREYQMVLRMAGSGHFSFGAFEYDEDGHHIGNNYSERHALSLEFQQFTFTYKASNNATGIRPSIAFLEPTDGTRMDVNARLRSFELPVSADGFSAMCESWPEYAKDGDFASYEGLTEVELKALRDLEQADAVLPPYTPITTQASGDFALTTSRIQFGSSVLPQQISVLGQDVMARPMELAIVYGDGTRLQLDPGETTAQSGPTRAVLSGQFRGGAHRATLSLEMHYDAFLIYTLSFPATPGASVASAALTIPFTSDCARYISYDTSSIPGASGEDGWRFGYGPIPRQGEQVETKAVVGSAHMGEATENDWQPGVPGADGLIWEWTRGVLPILWIGDESRGISFTALSTEGYRTSADEPTVRLVRDDDGVTVSCSFITEAAPLDKPRQLQFALQIMPPKPVREDWLASRYNMFFSGYPEIADESLPLLEARMKPGAAQEQTAEAIRPYLTAYDVIREGASPTAWQPTDHRRYRDIGFLWYTLLVGHPERLTRLVKCSDLIGHLGLPYLAGTHIAAEDPAGYYYVEQTDEWTHHPRIPRPAYLRPTCPNSLFSAYLAQGVGRLIDDYDIGGIYFDNCAPLMCSNTKHGCGYVDEDGVLRATLPLLGFRKLFMMVRAEFVKRGKQPFILTHAGLHPGSISFTDAELQGEGTYGSDHTQMMSLGEWRARWLGPHQFGVQMTYLPAFGYGLGPDVDRDEERRIGTPRLLAMSLLHGTQVWNQYLDSPLLYRVWSVLDELAEPDVTFVPYWQWPEINEALNAQDVYATGYSGKDRLLLVLTNLSDQEREVAVPLAQIAARAGAVSRAADNMHNLPVRVDTDAVRCTVGPKNFRLLSLIR